MNIVIVSGIVSIALISLLYMRFLRSDEEETLELASSTLVYTVHGWVNLDHLITERANEIIKSVRIRERIMYYIMCILVGTRSAKLLLIRRLRRVSKSYAYRER